MNEEKFLALNIGDSVQVKSWEQMSLEYGTTDPNKSRPFIKTPDLMVSPSMKKFCGKTLTIESICKRNNTITLKNASGEWTSPSGDVKPYEYKFTRYMLEDNISPEPILSPGAWEQMILGK